MVGNPGLLSEGPRWHEERQELLWVDILGRQMHRGTLSADGGDDSPRRVAGGRGDVPPTSARTGLDDDALAGQPHAGKVLAIDGLGFRGLPCLPYRGQVATDGT